MIHKAGSPSGAKARGVSPHPGDIFPVLGGAVVGNPVKFKARLSFNDYRGGGEYEAPIERVSAWSRRGLVDLIGPSETTAEAPSEAKAWPLKMAPADYIAKYEGQDDLSDEVKERLALARDIAG